ncbi:hypothetical protein H0H92_009171, partial [Tricholoma furcatifolium]
MKDVYDRLPIVFREAFGPMAIERMQKLEQDAEINDDSEQDRLPVDNTEDLERQWAAVYNWVEPRWTEDAYTLLNDVVLDGDEQVAARIIPPRRSAQDLVGDIRSWFLDLELVQDADDISVRVAGGTLKKFHHVGNLFHILLNSWTKHEKGDNCPLADQLMAAYDCDSPTGFCSMLVQLPVELQEQTELKDASSRITDTTSYNGWLNIPLVDEDWTWAVPHHRSTRAGNRYGLSADAGNATDKPPTEL